MYLERCVRILQVAVDTRGFSTFSTLDTRETISFSRGTQLKYMFQKIDLCQNMDAVFGQIF